MAETRPSARLGSRGPDRRRVATGVSNTFVRLTKIAFAICEHDSQTKMSGLGFTLGTTNMSRFIGRLMAT